MNTMLHVMLYLCAGVCFYVLQNLWFLLDKHQVPPTVSDEAMISYESFLKVGDKAGEKCK